MSSEPIQRRDIAMIKEGFPISPAEEIEEVFRYRISHLRLRRYERRTFVFADKLPTTRISRNTTGSARSWRATSEVSHISCYGVRLSWELPIRSRNSAHTMTTEAVSIKAHLSMFGTALRIVVLVARTAIRFKYENSCMWQKLVAWRDWWAFCNGSDNTSAIGTSAYSRLMDKRRRWSSSSGLSERRS